MQNEQAKSLIWNSVWGLVLVLSPAIVFGIINPDILNLNFAVDKLDLKAFEAAPAPVYTSEQQQRQCTALERTQQVPRQQNLPTGNECTRLGAGWAVNDDVCCRVTDPTRNVCCGYSRSNDTNADRPTVPTTQNPSGSFFIDYMNEDTNYDTGAKCVNTGTQWYATAQACKADARPAGSRSVIRHNCDGPATEYAPANVYNQIRNLPECP